MRNELVCGEIWLSCRCQRRNNTVFQPSTAHLAGIRRDTPTNDPDWSKTAGIQVLAPRILPGSIHIGSRSQDDPWSSASPGVGAAGGGRLALRTCDLCGFVCRLGTFGSYSDAYSGVTCSEHIAGLVSGGDLVELRNRRALAFLYVPLGAETKKWLFVALVDLKFSIELPSIYLATRRGRCGWVGHSVRLGVLAFGGTATI